MSGNAWPSMPLERMHDHVTLRLVAMIGTEAALILLLDISQPAQMHVGRFMGESRRRRLPLDR